MVGQAKAKQGLAGRGRVCWDEAGQDMVGCGKAGFGGAKQGEDLKRHSWQGPLWRDLLWSGEVGCVEARRGV